MTEAVYAILDGDRVVEYPVLPVHVLNRSLCYEVLSPVVFVNEMPSPAPDETIVEDKAVLNGVLYIEHRLVKLDLRRRLANIHHLMMTFEKNEPMMGLELKMAGVRNALEAHVQAQLDNAAKTNGYTSINDATSFVNSGVPQYKKEAKKATLLRDSVWMAFYDYIEKAEARQVRYPSSVEEVMKALPIIHF